MVEKGCQCELRPSPRHIWSTAIPPGRCGISRKESGNPDIFLNLDFRKRSARQLPSEKGAEFDWA